MRRLRRQHVRPGLRPAGATAAEWVRRLAPLGVVVSEIQALEQVLGSDLTGSRGLVVPLGAPEHGLRAIASPLKFSGYTPEYGLPPLLDEHRQQVLGKACV